MIKMNPRALAWLTLAIAAAAIGSSYPPAQGPMAVIFFIAFIGFFHSRLPKRIPTSRIYLISVLLGMSFGLLALVAAGGIYEILSGAIPEHAIAVSAAPFYEEFLKAGGVYVLALKRRRLLKSRRAVATCGFLGGLVFGVGEGLAQPSIYRPITAPMHALETMVFALGVRFMVIGKGRRAVILAEVYIAAAILSHMLWNAFAPLVLP